MQISASDTARVLYYGLDFIVLTVLVFLIIKLINNEKGLRYLTILASVMLLLLITSILPLPGAHLISQMLGVLAIISLPVVFHDEWVALLEKRRVANPAMNSGMAIIWSVVLSVFLMMMGLGLTVKTGRLPVEIPVTAVNVGEGLSANLGSQDSVRIIVAADRSKWGSLNENAFSATVDLADKTEGTFDLNVNVTSKVTDVEVRKIEPTRIVVTLEPVIKKTVPVVVKFSGTAGNELVPDVPAINPDKVEISGAKSVISNLTQATAAITLNGETQKIEQKVTLVAQNSAGDNLNGISFEPSEVTVSVNLVKAGKLKTVGVKPVISNQPAAGYWIKSVTTTPSAVSVTGSVEALDKVTEIATEAYSVANISEDTEAQVALALPNGITASDGTAKVKVKIDVEPSETTKSITPEIVYANLGASLKVASLNPASVATVVSGSSAQLAIVGGQVKINLELSAYKSAGTYSVTITNSMFTLPSGVSLVSYLPSAIEVVLENK